MAAATPHESFLRVNLRFGARTDRALLRELTAHTPYARARFIRRLILEGWRLHTCGQRAPEHAPPPPSISAAGDEAQFNDQVAALLGKTIRL